MTSHFLSMNDLSDAELRGVLDAADAFRTGAFPAGADSAKPLAVGLRHQHAPAPRH